MQESDQQKRKQEQVKYGVYYDDDYDYMQHLRDVNELNDVGPSEVYQIPAKQQQPDTKVNTDYDG